MTYAPFRNEATRASVLSVLREPATQAAWGRFFDTYAGFVFGIARHEGLPEADADEIVQIVMVELTRGGAATRYDKARGPFRGWLSRLVRWRVQSYKRHEARLEQAHREAADEAASRVGEEASGKAEDAFDAEWQATVFSAALERLRAETNPVHFQAYVASVIEGLDVPEVRRLCDISADNLYQIRRRIGLRFRTLLEETARDLDAPDLPPPSSGCR